MYEMKGNKILNRTEFMLINPYSDPHSTSAWRRSPTFKWQNPKCWAILEHWVRFPQPGPPVEYHMLMKFFYNSLESHINEEIQGIKVKNFKLLSAIYSFVVISQKINKITKN